jgi:hypothetical protein
MKRNELNGACSTQGEGGGDAYKVLVGKSEGKAAW